MLWRLKTSFKNGKFQFSLKNSSLIELIDVLLHVLEMQKVRLLWDV